LYGKILVPVDGSKTAALGLNEAIRLAKNQSARIRLVHIVNELIVVPPDAYSSDFGQVIDMLRTGGQAILNDAESAVRRAGIEVDTALVEAMGGHAGNHIVQQAKEWGADLMVCGTHGRRGIRRLVLGSDAEYIVRHTPVPILLVRSREPTSE
jgi:nucleotide-binding universal stress UspA family protein